ncbi:hypothetical protein FOA52_013832 [Chlamydomonas sp. UWO 241]|nr:hypothetical protein FOA52_013832 [Chlamydomonas sp. UWO 241]
MWARRCKGDGVELSVFSVPKGTTPNPKFSDIVGVQPFVPAAIGDSFGPSWTTHWFRLDVTVPASFAGLPGPILLVWDSGSEAMVYTEDGEPQQGFTDHRNEYLLFSHDVAPPGHTVTLYVEMAANAMFGTTDGIKPPAEDRFFKLVECGLAVPNVFMRQLFYDLVALKDLAATLPSDSAAGMDALYTANKVVSLLRPDEPGSWAAAADVAQAYLCASQTGDPTPGAAGARHKVVALGHCHIDTAWLWPFSETRRKTARSWSSQLSLMRSYPEHVFTASSAQQYEWLREDYPGLFARIQDAAAAGRFQPVGGTWVEMDTNVPGGESLVRQFLYGQRFFERHFGSRHTVFWLPDTFGYAAQLPQLMQGAGLNYFLTQKLSWNNINAFPHNTFMWQALDGTSVLTHFPPANTYCSTATAQDVLMSTSNSKDKDRCPGSLLLFGNGDGGGGPTDAMLESLRRFAGAASHATPGVGNGGGGGGAAGALPPLVIQGPDQFFRELEAASRDVLTWRGELYFELHRGTYTSHAANKAFNRRCEILLRDVEMLGCVALAVGAPGYSYPRAQLDTIWQDVLLYQFHDVLPGSAIHAVYDVALPRYAEMVRELSALRCAAAAAIAAAACGDQLPPAPAGVDGMEGVEALTITADDVAGAVPLPRAPHGLLPPPLSSGGGNGYGTSGGGIDGMYPPIHTGDRGGLYLCVPFVPSASLGRGAHDHSGGVTGGVDGGVNGGVTDGVTGGVNGGVTGGVNVVVHNSVHTGAPTPGPHTAAAAGRHHSRHVTPYVFNLLGFARTEVVEVDAADVPHGQAVRQYSSAGRALVPVSVPPLSMAPLFPQPPASSTALLGPEGHAHGDVGVEVMSWEGFASRFCAGVSMPLPSCPAVAAGGRYYVLYNDSVAACFDSSGRLAQLFDRSELRALVPAGGGPGNRYVMFEDMPTFWDAWDLEVTHLDKGWDAGRAGDAQAAQQPQQQQQQQQQASRYPSPVPGARVEVVEAGPLRGLLRVCFDLSPTSSIEQTISLTQLSARLEFEVVIDWAEDRRCLKVEFPTALMADTATYETQYGLVTRPTHANTSWDWAKFEVCAHRFADLSEPDYGVALLNDCKYGYATHGGTMRLTLLRSPKCPDPTTDIGRHVVRYALLPHCGGGVRAGGVVAAAARFNCALVPVPVPQGGSPPPSGLLRALGRPLLQVLHGPSRATGGGSRGGTGGGMGGGMGGGTGGGTGAPPLVIDCMKLAEEPVAPAAQQRARSSGGGGGACTLSLIVRMYEPHGCRGAARLAWDASTLRVREIVAVNLLEDELTEDGGFVHVCALPMAGSAGGPHMQELAFEFAPFKVLSFKLVVEVPPWSH